jgi:hypothetical protein
MATAPTSATPAAYPKVSRKIWWLLRERFKKTVPSAVSPTYVNSVSQMNDASALSNVIRPMRMLGLLDEENHPTELAIKWRHDDEYANVCKQIRDQVYPPDLVEAFPEADMAHKETIKNWFMKAGHVGEAAARMFADTYILLTQADPTNADEKVIASPQKPRTPKTKQFPPQVKLPINGDSQVLNSLENQGHQGKRRMPAVHIDVQVHISPDTSPEQIDRIFESMAKHLGEFQ